MRYAVLALAGSGKVAERKNPFPEWPPYTDGGHS